MRFSTVIELASGPSGSFAASKDQVVGSGRREPGETVPRQKSKTDLNTPCCDPIVQPGQALGAAAGV